MCILISQVCVQLIFCLTPARISFANPRMVDVGLYGKKWTFHPPNLIYHSDNPDEIYGPGLSQLIPKRESCRIAGDEITGRLAPCRSKVTAPVRDTD